MREVALYGRIRPKLATWGAVSRVENSTGSGMWDIHYCIEGAHGWVETKMEKAGKLYFERFQRGWARQQAKAGSRHLFLLYGRHESKTMFVVPAEELLKAPVEVNGKWTVVNVKDMVPCLVMHKPYDWEALRRVLSTGHIT